MKHERPVPHSHRVIPRIQDGATTCFRDVLCTQQPQVLGAKHVSDAERRGLNLFIICDWACRQRRLVIKHVVCPVSSVKRLAKYVQIFWHTIPWVCYRRRNQWLRHIILCHTIPYHTMAYHTIPYHTMSYHGCCCRKRTHDMAHHVISYYAIPCHPMAYHACSIKRAVHPPTRACAATMVAYVFEGMRTLDPHARTVEPARLEYEVLAEVTQGLEPDGASGRRSFLCRCLRPRPCPLSLGTERTRTRGCLKHANCAAKGSREFKCAKFLCS